MENTETILLEQAINQRHKIGKRTRQPGLNEEQYDRLCWIEYRCTQRVARRRNAMSKREPTPFAQLKLIIDNIAQRHLDGEATLEEVTHHMEAACYEHGWTLAAYEGEELWHIRRGEYTR